LKPPDFKFLSNEENVNPLTLGGFKSPSPRVQHLFFLKRKMTPKIYIAIIAFN